MPDIKKKERKNNKINNSFRKSKKLCEPIIIGDYKYHFYECEYIKKNGEIGYRKKTVKNLIKKKNANPDF